MICCALLLILRVVLLLSASASHAIDRNKNASKPSVAFVFAGAARSFVSAPVHESIRHNLIDSVCPRFNCNRQVFLRISSTDNVHRNPEDGHAVNATGYVLNITSDTVNKVEHAVNRLFLNTNEARRCLHVKWVQMSTESERQKMKSEFPSSRHTIFRELDPRRYSMYFNRWASFRMAADFEAATGRQFTWIVMARMDTLFGSPVQHISTWNTSMVWTQDLWQMEVADAFALIPRRFADDYFSMEKLMHPEVFCLGGPNFDDASLSPSNLINLGFKTHQFPLIRAEVCTKKCTDYLICGLSEQILKRKLDLSGIHIGYTTFFLLIVRYPLIPDCQNLRPDYQVESAMMTHYSNTATVTGCRALFHDMKSTYFAGTSGCHVLANHSKKQYSGECILNRYRSDMNFLPFRIYAPGSETPTSRQCLTFLQLTTSKSYILKFTPCIDVEPVEVRKMSFIYKYGRQQMFHFYPLVKEPQPMKFADQFNNIVQCLVVTNSSALVGTSCYQPFTKFTIDLKSRKTLKKRARKASLTGAPLLRSSEQVSFLMRSGGSSKGSSLCFTYKALRSSMPDVSDLVLERCTGAKQQIFTIERTATPNPKIVVI